MPNYIQFFDSIETIVCHATRYGNADIQLMNAMLGDFIVELTVNVTGNPIVEENPVTFNQFVTAIETVALYCQEQKVVEAEYVDILLGRGVTATFTTEWEVAGAFDKTTITFTASRTAEGETVAVIFSDCRLSISNIA